MSFNGSTSSSTSFHLRLSLAARFSTPSADDPPETTRSTSEDATYQHQQQLEDDAEQFDEVEETILDGNKEPDEELAKKVSEAVKYVTSGVDMAWVTDRKAPSGHHAFKCIFDSTKLCLKKFRKCAYSQNANEPLVMKGVHTYLDNAYQIYLGHLNDWLTACDASTSMHPAKITVEACLSELTTLIHPKIDRYYAKAITHPDLRSSASIAESDLSSVVLSEVSSLDNIANNIDLLYSNQQGANPDLTEYQKIINNLEFENTLKDNKIAHQDATFKSQLQRIQSEALTDTYHFKQKLLEQESSLGKEALNNEQVINEKWKTLLMDRDKQEDNMLEELQRKRDHELHQFNEEKSQVINFHYGKLESRFALNADKVALERKQEAEMFAQHIENIKADNAATIKKIKVESKIKGSEFLQKS